MFLEFMLVLNPSLHKIVFPVYKIIPFTVILKFHIETCMSEKVL